MTVRAVEGAAGCGKTYRLMEMLEEELLQQPLLEGQRVLALTFMHGSRRRLADRMGKIASLAGKFECSTVDGFAWRIYRRWRGLASRLGIPATMEDNFDAVCNAAGRLLEEPQVRNWVALSFPVVLVDEGQDLKPERLRILSALSQSANILIAADEFQCLDQNLRPNPLVDWLSGFNITETLAQVRRTNVADLLDAAAAVRAGNPPQSGQRFKILPPGTGIPLASTLLANAIAWRPYGGTIAVITPALQGGYAKQVVQRVTEQSCGRHGNGPYTIHWESSDRAELQMLRSRLQLDQDAEHDQVLDALQTLSPSGPATGAISWVENQVHACGRTSFTRQEIEAVLERHITLQRQHGALSGHRFTALTVQQAKNREFDGVVIIWPYQVGGDDEHKRRLLYNAITRAKHWCHVIAQGKSILQAAPFA